MATVDIKICNTGVVTRSVKFVIGGLFVIILLWLTACTTTSRRDNTDTLLFTDDYGREVTVPVYPKRVVSVSPSITEILFALGADSLLVGRTMFCTYPPQAMHIENIGGISNLNIEKVLSLQPDLVLGASMIPQKSAEHLQQLGIPVVCVIEKPHFDGLYANITKIGHLVGCEAQADSLNRYLHQRLSLLPDTTQWPPYSERPSVYYVVGFGKGGNFTAGGNSFINDIIRMAGGRNIAEDVTGWSISLEVLMDRDPDWIVIRKEDKDAFCHMEPYTRLTAVRQGHIIPIESGLIDLQVPRNIDGVLAINAYLTGAIE